MGLGSKSTTDPGRPVDARAASRAALSAAFRQLSAILALAGLALALATQFAISHRTSFPYIGVGFLIAALCFAGGALSGRLLPSTRAASTEARPFVLKLRWEIALLACVVALAIFFRFFRFTQFPPGLWFDEAVNGTDALSIIDGDHFTVWRTSNFGHSTMYFYLLIASFRSFGYTLFAFRLVPALAGLAAVAAVYLLGRSLLGPIPALVAAALMAVARFPVTFSRISWEASLQPALETMAVFFLFQAIEKKSRLFFALAGAYLAAGLYTYLAFRFVPVMIAFFLLYIAIAERRAILRNVPGLAIYAATFVLVVAPLAWFALGHQDEK